MKTELRKSYSYGFVLDEQELRRIFSILVKQIAKVTSDQTINVKLNFKNDVVTEKPSLDECLLEQNGGPWTIEKLQIQLSEQKASTSRITLEFSSQKNSSNINYNIQGHDRDWVYITSSELEERITKIKKIP